MIKTVIGFISEIEDDLSKWDTDVVPWFRGESGNEPALCPKIASFKHNQENHILQSFRRQAGGLANVPDRNHTDMWLFLAQHYGAPTRLLDWTEGALLALYFAINIDKPYPRVYMLNPRKLNECAGVATFDLNYPLSWGNVRPASYIALAWQNRKLEQIKKGLKEGVVRRYHYLDTDAGAIERELKEIDTLSLEIPIAFPATYQDQRMIAQRSCFTIHGSELKPMEDIFKKNNIEPTECLFKYEIDGKERVPLLKQLSYLGISAATIFPDLDHLTQDLQTRIKGF